MYLECTCCDINQSKWDRLMKGATRTDKVKLNRLIKHEMPELYEALFLNLYNPYNYYKTKTHWVLVHSAIEYFIKK
jgi:hypothetical protein